MKKPAIRVAGAGPAARNVSTRGGDAETSEIVICVVRFSTIVTVRSAEAYLSFTTVSVWFPTVMLGSEIGVTPRLIVSSRIRAPSGIVVMSSEPVNGISVPLTSVVFPDSTRTDVDNSAYPDRENITQKVPGSILSMIRGVLPRYCPSMITDAPTGEVLRLSVPGISGELIFITGVPSFMEIVL